MDLAIGWLARGGLRRPPHLDCRIRTSARASDLGCSRRRRQDPSSPTPLRCRAHTVRRSDRQGSWGWYGPLLPWWDLLVRGRSLPGLEAAV